MLRGSFVRLPSDVVGGPEKLRRERVINQKGQKKDTNIQRAPLPGQINVLLTGKAPS